MIVMATSSNNNNRLSEMEITVDEVTLNDVAFFEHSSNLWSLSILKHVQVRQGWDVHQLRTLREKLFDKL
jgi:hypothetical protein